MSAGETNKCDRALELREQGLSYAAIAERLGIRTEKGVSSYIRNGKRRREDRLMRDVTERS